MIKGIRVSVYSLLIFLIIFQVFSSFEAFAQNGENGENGIGGTWDSDEISSLETGATISAGFATAGALIFLGYQTMKLRAERNLTLRAWIGQGEPRFYLDGYLNAKGEFIEHEKWKQLSDEKIDQFNVTKLRYYIETKNFGQIPAHDLQVRTKFFVGTKPEKKDIQSVNFLASAILMPGQTSKLFYSITKDESLATDDTSKNCYLIWDIKYKSSGSKNIETIGMIVQVSTMKYGILESWTTSGEKKWFQKKN